MFGSAKKFARRVRTFLSSDAEKNLFLTGQLSAKITRNMRRISSLSDVEFKVWSQWGEDGIIDWLVERLDVPTHSFVEFGVQTYIESNTRFLLANRNWRGMVIDGSPENIGIIRGGRDFWKHDLAAVCAFIDRDNINEIIGSRFRGEIGILSIDIDGNDYWILEKIDVVSPVILICEYNSVFGDVWPISVPYDPKFYRTRAHHSNLYFGASLAAIKHLAEQKGYKLVGTSAGVNAFFVRSDYVSRLDGSIARNEGTPSRVRESKDVDGRKTLLAGLDRLNAIADMPVVNVVSGDTTNLGALQPIYSDAWVNEICAGSN